MKHYKYIFLVIFFSLATTIISAQCVPDTTLTKPSIYPDTLINLDTAVVNSYYEMVMTAVVPKDTLFFGTRIPIDSIGISKFEGLPSGFTMVANTASAYWKGGSSGCVVITGTPSSSDIGEYPISIQVIAVVAGTPAPYPVPGYKLVITGNSGYLKNETLVEEAIMYPNPFCDQSSITFFSPVTETCVMQIFNSSGCLVKSSNHIIVSGTNNILVQNDYFGEGMYFYSLISENLFFANKFIIKY